MGFLFYIIFRVVKCSMPFLFGEKYAFFFSWRVQGEYCARYAKFIELIRGQGGSLAGWGYYYISNALHGHNTVQKTAS